MILAGLSAIRRLSAKSVVKWRRHRPAALILLATFAATGCAVSPIGDSASGGAAADLRDAVAKRAAARWSAMIKGDWSTAYSLMSPSSRAEVTLEQFTAGVRKDSYREVEIDRVECAAEACSVRLHLTYDHPLIKGLRTGVEETWIFDNGQPWYVYRR
jgi:hypothetical protein